MKQAFLADLPKPPHQQRGWPWTEEVTPPARSRTESWPRLSIVTPSYNQGQFLEATIRSVLLQGYPNLEYIVMDGGSSDDSVEIIKKYEPWIKHWVSEKDAGQSDAINKGLHLCTGDILGWVNSDDLYTPGAFFKVINAFQNNPECVLVHGDRILIDGEGSVTGWSPLPPFNPESYGFNVCSETAFWRRDVGEQVGDINADLQFAMDLEFFSRIYKIGKFCKLEEYLGCFRCHESSKSATIWESVGTKEAEREWKRIFGADNENWSVSPNIDMLRHRLALLYYPKQITIPYLQYRFRRLRSGNRTAV